MMHARDRLWILAAALFVGVSSAAAATAGCSSSPQTTGGGPSYAGGSGGGDDGSSPSTGGGSGAANGGSSGVGSSRSGSGASSGGNVATDAGARASSSPGGDAGGAGADGATTPSAGCLMAGGGDYSKAGPYAVTTKAGIDLTTTGDLPLGDAGPTTFTAYYPTNMDDHCLHPIVSWANGTGVTGSNVYAFFNNNAASWGIVVMASDNPSTGSGDYNKAGIDYLLAQNKNSASPFYQRLSGRAGVAGHSQGAFGATMATSHPNVQAEVQVEGGGVPKAGIAFVALSGTADNVVGTGPPTQSFTAATGPSMLAIYTGADHVTTPTLGGYVQNNPGTIQFMRVYTAWFRCFLADDAPACALFRGGRSCGLCSDTNWATLETKNM